MLTAKRVSEQATSGKRKRRKVTLHPGKIVTDILKLHGKSTKEILRMAILQEGKVNNNYCTANRNCNDAIANLISLNMIKYNEDTGEIKWLGYPPRKVPPALRFEPAACSSSYDQAHHVSKFRTNVTSPPPPLPAKCDNHLPRVQDAFPMPPYHQAPGMDSTVFTRNEKAHVDHHTTTSSSCHPALIPRFSPSNREPELIDDEGNKWIHPHMAHKPMPPLSLSSSKGEPDLIDERKKLIDEKKMVYHTAPAGGVPQQSIPRTCASPPSYYGKTYLNIEEPMAFPPTTAHRSAQEQYPRSSTMGYHPTNGDIMHSSIPHTLRPTFHPTEKLNQEGQMMHPPVPHHPALITPHYAGFGNDRFVQEPLHVHVSSNTVVVPPPSMHPYDGPIHVAPGVPTTMPPLTHQQCPHQKRYFPRGENDRN